MNNKNKADRGGILPAVLTGSLAACACSVALAALFALALQKQWLGVESVSAFNVAVKLICAAVAALIAVRGRRGRTVLRASLAAGGYMLLTFIVFSLISGEFSPSGSTAVDIVMCMLCGAVVGIVKNLSAK